MNAPSLARISTIISPRKFPPEADTIVIRILLEAVSDGLSSKGQFTNGAYTKVSEELLGAGYMYAASSVQRRFYKVRLWSPLPVHQLTWRCRWSSSQCLSSWRSF